MAPSYVLLLAFLMGVVSGLRSLTAPAVVAWAACRNWINLNKTALSFMGSTVAVAALTFLAHVEKVADKLPRAPSRTKPAGLIARIIFGALSGAAIAGAGAQSMALGGVLGAAGGIAGAFGGYHARTGLAKALKVPDFVIALFEDVVTIAGGLVIALRF